MTQFPVYLPYILFDLESTWPMQLHDTDQMPSCIRRLKVEMVYFSEIFTYLKQLMHLLA